MSLLLMGVSQAEQPIDFGKDIRPIFTQYCYACHGPDSKARQAEFRVDLTNELFKKLDSSRVPITAGNLNESELYKRLVASDPERHMPPSDFGHQPSLTEITLIKRWIEQGAKWENHWSFEPIVKPKIPEFPDSPWIKNPLDAFVLEKVQERGMKVNSQADSLTLLRRLRFNLTGLPPTIEEINLVQQDNSLETLQIIIEQLLSSPHFGEHQARFFLDAARYADTHGYNIDSHRDMWRYREVLIEAFNRNIPFDQFTIEQLAGDLLPDATIDQITASGFNRNHPINDEMGAIPAEYRHAYVVDRVNTVSTVWLGLTMGCAECHDHKYDPFTQEDYYGLYAIFNNIDDLGLDGKRGNAAPFFASPTAEQQAQLKEIEKKFLLLKQKKQAAISKQKKRILQGELNTQNRNQQVSPKAVAMLRLDEKTGSKAKVIYTKTNLMEEIQVQKKNDIPVQWISGKRNNSLLLEGSTFLELPNTKSMKLRNSFSLSFWLYPTSSQAATLLKFRYDNSSLTLLQSKSSLQLEYQTAGENPVIVSSTASLKKYQWNHLLVSVSSSNKNSPLIVFHQNHEIAWSNLKPIEKKLTAEIPKSILLGGQTQGQGFRGMLDEVQLFPYSLSQTAIHAIFNSDLLVDLQQKKLDELNAEELIQLADLTLLRDDPEYLKLLSELSTLSRIKKNLVREFPETMVMEELKTRRKTYLLRRGKYDHPVKEIHPTVPENILPWSNDSAPDRLSFAKWLIDKRNPLTARVIANRIWQQYFGNPLVQTPEDFGIRGELPSHPLLLDYLAWYLIENHWDLKSLHRLIVSSATYQQSSHASAAQFLRDPENRWLCRGPRQRLSGEEIRDQALAVSDLLVRKVGGPSVRPYQPKNLWREISYGSDFTSQYYRQDHGEKLYRRSIYTYWKRSMPPPLLALFNAPNRELCTVSRTATNTPLQALAMMNDPTFVEASRVLAANLMQKIPTEPEQQIDQAFITITSRHIKQNELKLLQELYAFQLAEFKANPEAATSLLKVGEKQIDYDLDPIQLATLAYVCQTIFNLDEALTVN